MLIVNIFRITEAVAGVAAAFYCCFTASVPWELFLIVDASAFIALMLQAAVQLILLSLWLLRQLISKQKSKLQEFDCYGVLSLNTVTLLYNLSIYAKEIMICSLCVFGQRCTINRKSYLVEQTSYKSALTVSRVT